MPLHHFIVGTFNTPVIFTLAFDPSGSLEVVAKSESTGPHSWLSLNPDRSVVYATAWTEPPGLAAYRITNPSLPLSLINTVTTRARSGYCCNSAVAVYSAGGPTGEVFAIDSATGGFKDGSRAVVQELNFVDQDGRQRNDGSVMDFGGLRHGAHSADLSHDGELLFVADIGRNCIFVYRVQRKDGSLTLTDKNVAPRPTDGPRHVTPHPNDRYVYSLQEHTSMVDVFEVTNDDKLVWRQGVKIIPAGDNCARYWADEVRLSPSQRWLYASTRGLESATKGWVAVFAMDPTGLLKFGEPLALWETPTSGGWANAVEPAPKGISTLTQDGGCDYLALTDSEEGLVMVLSWDGKAVEELARTKLPDGAGAATAVWLD